MSVPSSTGVQWGPALRVPAKALRRAVFFDRDGCLIEEVGYAGDPAFVRLIEGAAESVESVQNAGMPAIVVSNQSGIARGLLTEMQVAAVNARFAELLHLEGVQVDDLFFCPHHPEGAVEAFRQVCDCRKPAPGMLHQAAEKHRIDLKGSFVIGDKISDVELAHAVGAKGILVRTGYGNEEFAKAQARGVVPDFVAENVLEAVRWLLLENEGSSSV